MLDNDKINNLWQEISRLRQQVNSLNNKVFYLQDKIDKIKVILYE